MPDKQTVKQKNIGLDTSQIFNALVNVSSGGIYVITREMLPDLFKKVSVEEVPGIGPNMKKVLNRIGIWKVSDVMKYPHEYLTARLGKFGKWLYNIAR